jgi:hypothetical protein
MNDHAEKRRAETQAREQHVRAAAQSLAAYGVALPETLNEMPDGFGRSIYVAKPLPVRVIGCDLAG